MTSGMTAPGMSVGVPKDAVVSLPGGKTISLADLAKLREGGVGFSEDDTIFLGKPELLLKNPKKGCHYGWPLRSLSTAGKIRQRDYRKVTIEELREDTPYPVATQEGVGGGQVEWNNHVLVEMTDEVYQRRFVAPQWRGTEQLARLQERLNTKADQLGLHITPEVTATPVASY